MSGGKDKEVSVWEVEEYWPETQTFNGKPVVNITSEDITDPSAVALLVSQPVERGWSGTDLVVFDAKDTYQYLYDSKISPAVVKAFHNLLTYKGLAAVDTLVIGPWGGRHTDSTDMKSFLDLLLEHESHFSGLKALFVGGASLENTDIHDIQLYQLGSLLNYFSQLEYLKVRGAPNQPNQGKNLHHFYPPAHLRTFFEEPIDHPNLKKLVIETADMDLQTIDNLVKSHLPKLEHLELWFGAYRHIHFHETDQLMMLTHIRALLKNKLPSLRYLGLRNSCQANKIAVILADAPIVSQLDELDLSLGNLTDRGAKALYKSPYIGNLKKLNIYHHAIRNIQICQLLEEKIPEVNYRLDTWLGDGEERLDDEDSYNIYMYE